MSLERIRSVSLFLLETNGGLPLAAHDALMEFYRQAKELGSWADVIQALLASGVNWLNMKRPKQALEQFEEALQLIEEHGLKGSVSWFNALFDLALAYEMIGVVDRSIHYAQQVWEYVERGGKLPYDCQVALLLGKLQISQAIWDLAYRFNMEALQRFEASGDTNGASKALNNLGLVCIEIGEYAEAEELLQRALAAKRQLNDASGSVYTLTELGRLYYQRGDLASAVRYSRKALQTLWENVAFVDKAEVARLCRVFGSVAARTGDRQGAISYLQRAITYYAQLNQWREWSAVTQELDSVIRTRQPTTVVRAGIEWQDKEILRNLTTLLGLLDTLEGLYPELRGKSELVTKYALLLGDACGLEGSSRESLSHAARLINIGFTFPGLDPDKANRGGVDSDENPVLAERVLRMVSVSEECRAGIRHQRERVDGLGYPDGLKGDEIPLISRILAIADAYVTRATAGGTGAALHQHAMEYLHSHAGSKFDERLVNMFASLHEYREPDS